MKMKIGLLMGTFDPIHIGHISIALKVLGDGLVDRLYFVPSPQNPWKKTRPASFEIRGLMIKELLKNELVDFKPALGLCHGAFCDYNPVDLQDEDGNFYSYKQLEKIQIELGPENDFFIIGGQDVEDSISGWKNYDWIKENFQFIGLPRPGFTKEGSLPEGPVLALSSTDIRNLVEKGKPIIPWVARSTAQIIKRYNLYRDER